MTSSTVSSSLVRPEAAGASQSASASSSSGGDTGGRTAREDGESSSKSSSINGDESEIIFHKPNNMLGGIDQLLNGTKMQYGPTSKDPNMQSTAYINPQPQ